MMPYMLYIIVSQITIFNLLLHKQMKNEIYRGVSFKFLLNILFVSLHIRYSTYTLNESKQSKYRRNDYVG